MNLKTRLLHHAACLTGAAALVWVAYGAFGTHPLALAVTAAIALFYGMGTLELHRFHRANAALAQALATPPATQPALEAWLEALPAPLRTAVRQRIDHPGRGPLPSPALTPTLTGLLVLLGMLGTFLGMVATLHGTGLALEHATELDALREALSAPVKGLGLAFGTSVAGVATSAMLGLMTALARRERAEVAQALDRQIATTLQPFSQAHRTTLQQDETLRALQRQAEAVPAMLDAMVNTIVTPLMDRLQGLMNALEQQQRHTQQGLLDGQLQAQQRLSDQQLQAQQRLQDTQQHAQARQQADQQQFLARTEAAFTTLAGAVERSLQDSLAQSAAQAHATLQPMLEATLAGLARDAGALHAQLGDTVQRQMDGMTDRLADSGAAQAAHWQQALAEHRQQQQAAATQLQSALAQFTSTFEARSAALVQDLATRFGESHTALQAGWAQRDSERLDAWRDTVATMAADLRDTWQQAGERSAAQQQQVCDTLAETARAITDTTQAQARDTVAEIGRLLQAAAEAPRAAAEVIGELRSRLTDAMARDNAMLDERQRLLDTLGTLLGAVNQASTEQRSAIDTLVGSAATLLQQAGERLQAQADAHDTALAEATTQAQASAVEVASLGETFGFAVQRFGASNDALMAQLQRIEAALSQSLTRSDEQLAYYVAQAREVIDLSLSSQKQIIEDLQALARREAAA